MEKLIMIYLISTSILINLVLITAGYKAIKNIIKRKKAPTKKVTAIYTTDKWRYKTRSGTDIDTTHDCKFTKTRNGYIVKTDSFYFEIYNAAITNVFYEKTT